MFEVESFVENNPEFSDVNSGKIKSAHSKALLYLEKYCSHINNQEKNNILLELMISHLLSLEKRGNDIVGNVEAAQAGSVSIGFDSLSLSKESSQWLNQTQYGAIFHQLTQENSYARYIT